MVELNRCACGYLHVGPAPEHCPVCGAPASAFSPFTELPNLEGTKTLENLKAAFAGESQANRKYTLWRRIAELEGAPASALAAFDRAAAEETAHALGHLAYMGGFGTTAENLKAAAGGEDYECTEMYPSFAETADAEGLSDIAGYFRVVGKFEAEHRGAYVSALEELENA
ncbi:MAG: rubrerythrin [Coriobacteriia bacterium]|nr:rubrerythrin [Coriobacteriia bacterium]